MFKSKICFSSKYNKTRAKAQQKQIQGYLFVRKLRLNETQTKSDGRKLRRVILDTVL